MKQAEIRKRDEEAANQAQMKAVEAKEQKRRDEIAARDARIQRIMNNMGDQVVDHGKELQKKQEKEFIETCLAKDEQHRRFE